MAGGQVHIVMAGNPTAPAGAFYDAFTRERALWNSFTISVFDSPNLKGITLDQLLEMDPADGGPLDQNLIPYLVTRRWVHDQHRSWWHGDPGSSPNWISRVLADFPSQAENALFKMIWLERAKQRAVETPATGVTTNLPLFAGVDVGGGQSETVIYVCEFRQGRIGIVGMGAWRGQDTRGQTVRFLKQFQSRLCVVNVDSIGVGHNFANHLRDERFPVETVNVALPCQSKPNLGENDLARRFVNQKACFYQTLADAFERDQIDGLTDEETIGQLAGIRWELDSQGRTKIESKEDARRRGVPSPDRAEALMLAVSKPPRKYEYFSVRDLPRMESGSSSWDRPNHNDDLDAPGNIRLVRSRRWDGWVGPLRWPRGGGAW
jgi:phage terminase large subunit